MKCGISELNFRDADNGLIELDCPPFHLRTRPALRLDGEELSPTDCSLRRDDGEELRLEYQFAGEARLTLAFRPAGGGIGLRAWLRNVSGSEQTLGEVTLLRSSPDRGALVLGGDPARVMVMEQGNYWGKVRPLSVVEEKGRASDLFWVAHDREARRGFLAGFTTSERWLGRIEVGYGGDGKPGCWRMGFDGGDWRLEPGQEVELEEVLFLAGSDPWKLLEDYAEAVQQRHGLPVLETTPVSWCSWYPYRLGVTEERIVETARLAAERLKPLGLSIVEVDLGWERENLPNAFEENERFSRGLGWLAEELRKLGLELGVWKAPFTISEFDPVCREHPEWLVQDETGEPAGYWEWYWEPHGKVFILDLTHPGAQQWLGEKIASLHERGVRYFKADFIGCVSHGLAKRRHDRGVVGGGGVEAARIGARIIRQALPEALLLNCGGPEMPGRGHWPLFYTCNDTGNTGFLTQAFMRDNYLTLACHLFKNRRWGVLQPSCLCVGLPGSLEEARLRATLTFLAGGQIDISDTLTSLPEDRWAVLTATLPPLGISAKPVDLFEPVTDGGAFAYATTRRGEDAVGAQANEHPPGSVWHLRVEADWEAWDLVGVFSFEGDSGVATPRISRYAIPFARLGLPPGSVRQGFEFWSGQYLGRVPGKRTNAGGYAHPGDMQDLLAGDGPDLLDIAFFGPGAKLICLRQARPYPWVVGTSFHQSCGAELRKVVWDPDALTLSGEIDRPAGAAGLLVLDGAGLRVVAVEEDGRSATCRRGANGAWIVPLTVSRPGMGWRIAFAAAPV